MIKIKHLDHFVLTVSNLDKTIDFYTCVLGMKLTIFGEERKALCFGNQKINLHQKEKTFDPKAKLPTCGSADICFIVETPLKEVVEILNKKNLIIEEGIVHRTGALGAIISIYIRDPDENLIEISNYV